MLNMVKFQLKNICKMPIFFINMFLYPVILTAIIGYLTRSSFGSDVTSYQFYAISMMIFMFMGGGLTSAYNFIDEPIKAGNLRTMYTPVKTSNIYLSEIITGTIYCTLAIIFSMIASKVLFGVNYNGNAILVFLSLTTLTFFSNALGILFCTLTSNIMTINMIYNLMQGVLCILGGAFFSLESLGEIPAKLSMLSPVKWIMDGILNSMYDNKNTLIIGAIIVNVILALGLIALCKKTFKTEKYI